MDPFDMHMENLCGCNDEGFDDEPEPDDQLHLALAAAYSQLNVTTVDQIREGECSR